MTTFAPTLPAGANGDIWELHKGRFGRVIWATPRFIPDREDVLIAASAVKLDDGSIDDGSHSEAPMLHIEISGCRALNTAQARELAAAILAAADEIDGWRTAGG